MEPLGTKVLGNGRIRDIPRTSYRVLGTSQVFPPVR